MLRSPPGDGVAVPAALAQGHPLDRRRRALVVAGVCSAARGGAAAGQRRVGVLGNTESYVRTDEWKAFVAEMTRLGYTVDREVVFLHRYAGTYSQPQAAQAMARLTRELVAAGVDVIYAVDDGGSALAAKQVTASIPIVFDRSWADPVEAGLVASLARPGGNVTGNATLGIALEAKAIEALLEITGRLPAVGVLHTSALKTFPRFQALAVQRRATARALGVELAFYEADTVEGLADALSRMRRDGLRAAKFDDPEGFDTRREEVARVFAAHRIAAVSTAADYARVGLLLGFGWDVTSIARRSAAYVARILRGAQPAELPVEQVSKVHLVVNRRTAQTLGLPLPGAVLARADEVIG